MNSKMLYDIAYQCSDLKRRGCSNDCIICPMNVSHYTTTEKEALLFKTSSMIDAHKMLMAQVEIKKQYFSTTVLGWVVLILIIMGAVSLCSLGKQRPPESDPNVADPEVRHWFMMCEILPDGVPARWHERYEAYYGRSARGKVLDNPARPDPAPTTPDIWAVINRTAKQVRDRNNDHIVNCIDYAWTFQDIFPAAGLVWQLEHEGSTLNHLFVKIYVNSKWLYIEPNSMGRDSYYMEYCWGRQYDPEWNIDITRAEAEKAWMH